MNRLKYAHAQPMDNEMLQFLRKVSTHHERQTFKGVQ